MNNRSNSACSSCGKSLTDPVSVELGIGPVCRTQNKIRELEEKTINMFANRSRYDWGITPDGKVLYITDEGGLKSVTNDMENVLRDITETIAIRDLKNLRIMYRDSIGIWDGVRVSFTENLVTDDMAITCVAFYPLTERDFGKAKDKILTFKIA